MDNGKLDDVPFQFHDVFDYMLQIPDRRLGIGRAMPLSNYAAFWECFRSFAPSGSHIT